MLLDSFRQRKTSKDLPANVETNGIKGMKRRNFLATASAGAAALFGASRVPGVRDVGKDIFKSQELKKSIEEKIKIIRDKYGMDILGTPLDTEGVKSFKLKVDESADISGNEASLSKSDRALSYIISEFSKYPAFFIKKLNIPRISIRDSLREKDKQITGAVHGSGAYVNSMEVEVSSGLLNSGKLMGLTEELSFRINLEHELFHIFTNVYGEQFLENWVKLSPYGLRENAALGRREEVREHYKDNYREDLAHTASLMMTNFANLWDNIKDEKNLAEKVEFIKHLIFNKTYGLINEEYWDLLKNGKLNSAFFENRRFYLLSLNFEDFKRELRNPSDPKNYLELSEAKGVSNEEGVYRVFQGFLSESTL